MTELTATVQERATAAQHAHEYSRRRQLQAQFARDPIQAAFWADIGDACLAELEECACAARAGLDLDRVRIEEPPAHDGIFRGNTDLPALSGHAYLR